MKVKSVSTVTGRAAKGRPGAGIRGRNLSGQWLAFTLYLALAGCSTASTSVGPIWQDVSRPDTAQMGKTLVLVLWSEPHVITVLEDEWVRQLRDQGIEAQAVHLLQPDDHPHTERDVIELVGAGGFNTLLVNRVIGVKAVEREAPGSEVAVVETVLYDAATEQRFWSARADTFMHHPASDRTAEQRAARARDFVGTLLAAMSKSGVL